MPIDVNARELLAPNWRIPLEYNTGMRAEVIIGVNPDIDQGSIPEDIWSGGGLYTGFPSVTEQVRLTSTNAADTAAGTGARTVLIRGLDDNFKQISEVITMNGTTPVVSVNSYRRLHRAQVITTGTGGANAGDITVRHNVTTANVFAVVYAGDSVNRDAVFTVPAGHTGLITRVFFEIVSGARLRISLRAKVNGVDTLVIPYHIASGENREKIPSFGGQVSEKTDLYFRATETDALAANIICTAGFDIVTVERTA